MRAAITTTVEGMDAKPCPFCCSTRIRVAARTLSHARGHCVECIDCGAGQHKLHRSAAAALEAWNRRAGVPQVVPAGYVLVPVSLSEIVLEDLVAANQETRVVLSRLETTDAGRYADTALHAKRRDRAAWLKAAWSRLLHYAERERAAAGLIHFD